MTYSRDHATERIDRALVTRGLAGSRARAARLIDAGEVSVNGRVVTDRAFLVGVHDVVASAAPDLPWVSRGALKLLAALDAFRMDPSGKTCLDIGASTGGFTEVLLSRGAQRVVALDVGTGQLHPRLREDPRVQVLEGVHIVRDSDRKLSEAPYPLIVIDVSFISLLLVLPRAAKLCAPGGSIIALIKPQFEVGRARIGRGVVRDPRMHDEVIERVRNAAVDLGLVDRGCIPSPIDGGDGNQEWLLVLDRPADVRHM